MASIIQIETARLRMRPLVLDDIDALHAHWTDPQVRKYLWDDIIIPREQVVEVIESSLTSFAMNDFGFWAVFPKENVELIGFCGFRFFSEPPEIEMLYSIAPKYSRQGLATEASKAMLRFGFEEKKLDRIYAGADPPNAASFRVMEKCGMTFAKRIWLNNLEAVYYVITKEAFQPGDAFYKQVIDRSL
jgi:ribosomal-protein-alanine N-acetyltransferase